MGFIKVFLLTVLVFGVLIFVHELGHFIAARAFKVKVNEFAIGMGPAIFSRKSKRSGTLYSLRLLPIGLVVFIISSSCTIPSRSSSK